MYDKIECLECGRELGTITGQHLKGCCGMTIKQYKIKHPNAETISEKVKDIRRKTCKNMTGKTKIVKCSTCKKDMETAAVNRWDYICDECRKPETFEGQSYVKEKDLVVCQICWVGLEQITWMHTKSHNLSLPEYRKLFPTALVTNKKIRKQRRERHTGKSNPSKRPEVQKKMKKAQRFTAKQWAQNYPWIFPNIEQIRDVFDIVEVRCKKCGRWFEPTGSQLGERIRSLTNDHGSDGAYLYCSNECKGSCPLYRLQPVNVINDLNRDKEDLWSYTDSEYEIFKNEVLKRQRNGFGKNFCEICEEEEKLNVHHEKPKKTHPHMILDPDNGIILCKKCHDKYGHSGDCSKSKLANLICTPKISKK